MSTEKTTQKDVQSWELSIYGDGLLHKGPKLLTEPTAFLAAIGQSPAVKIAGSGGNWRVGLI